ASAAARSEEAARQLRDLESRMQAGSPDTRRRALGDLQLESQQVAEAQRRIAREADRLDREGGGTVDARRRLAGEKEQLADRVDAGGARGDAQRLADQLDHVRDARERLARLEQQVTQAQRDEAAKQAPRGGGGRGSQPSTDGERGSASGDLQRLQQEYTREAPRT